MDNPQKEIELMRLGVDAPWWFGVLEFFGFIGGIVGLGWIYGTILSRMIN